MGLPTIPAAAATVHLIASLVLPEVPPSFTVRETIGYSHDDKNVAGSANRPPYPPCPICHRLDTLVATQAARGFSPFPP
jgi:hypothetical protein